MVVSTVKASVVEALDGIRVEVGVVVVVDSVLVEVAIVIMLSIVSVSLVAALVVVAPEVVDVIVDSVLLWDTVEAEVLAVNTSVVGSAAASAVVEAG